MGFDTLQRRPRARVLPLQGQQAAPRSSTRAATSTSRRSTPAPTCAARRSSRSSSSASTSSTPTTRSARRQHEIDMRYADALKMADDCMTYRITVKEYAHEVRLARDVHAQAAVRRERLGHAHAHVAVHATARNAFFDADDTYFLSDVGKAFIAGQLRHAREICSIFAQWVNSYKRLVPGYEAPVYVAWWRRNRSALVRVPLYHPGKEQADADGAALPRPGVQPVPDVRRAAAGRPRGHREGLRAARADGEEPLPPGARTTGGGSASSSCPRRSARRSS